MILEITNKPIHNAKEAYHISPEKAYFNNYIPFILANEWDKCILELTDAVQTGVLNQVLKGVSIYVILPEGELTRKQSALLCELYPQLASKIRASMRTKKETIATVLGGNVYA